MRERFRRFMAGRYGNDGLNQFLNIVSLVFLVLALLTRVGFLYYVALGILVLMYCRAFSRNISARSAENYKYYTLKDQSTAWWRSKKTQWDSRKQYRYFTCPQCRQKLRVPRGRGRIQISCPRCGNQFIKKS